MYSLEINLRSNNVQGIIQYASKETHTLYYIISVLLHSCIITTTNTTTLYGAPVNTNLVLGDITTKCYQMNRNSVWGRQGIFGIIKLFRQKIAQKILNFVIFVQNSNRDF